MSLLRFVLPAACVAALTVAPTAAAEPVGRFALVQNEVRSHKPGAPDAVSAAAGDAIVLDEREVTGASSAAKLLFGEGAVISLGQNTTFQITREAVAEATGASASVFDVAVGKARIFVSRLWSGRPDVRVRTPAAVLGVKGSEVVVEVFPDGRTVVTVLGGEIEVTPRAGRARPVVLTRGRRLRLTADGIPLGDVEAVLAADEARLLERTEPEPVLGRVLPQGQATLAAPSQAEWDAAQAWVQHARERWAANSTTVSATSALFVDPTTSVFPETAALLFSFQRPGIPNDGTGNFRRPPGAAPQD